MKRVATSLVCTPLTLSISLRLIAALCPLLLTNSGCDGLLEARSVEQVGRGAAVAPHALTIATWNIAHLRAQDGQGPNPRVEEDFRRLQRVAASLRADVIAVQEVDGEEALSRVFDPERYAFAVADQPGTQLTGFAYRRELQVRRQPDYQLLDVGGLRYGVDISVELGASSLRLLAVHLKASCVSDPIQTDTNACRKFSKQVPVLEAWIDERAREGTPFIVLGDFNRRFFARTDGDEVWRDLDDGQPAGVDLSSPTMGQRARCWDGRYPQFIDHLVMDQRAAAWLVPGSFAQHTYEAPSSQRDVLSDHCPLSVQLSMQQEVGDDRRAQAPRGEETPRLEESSADGLSMVKGNISRSGKRLYHTPDCPSYERVQIDPDKGERLFPSASAAEAAGFARAGNCPR